MIVDEIQYRCLERAGGNGENQKASPKSYFDGDKYLHTVSLKNNCSTHKLFLAGVYILLQCSMKLCIYVSLCDSGRNQVSMLRAKLKEQNHVALVSPHDD